MEYFGWGKYGGIGKATKDIAEGLVKKGITVHAIVPRGHGQVETETVEGVKVHSFPLNGYQKIGGIIRKVDTDIYHSQDPNLGTLIGMSAMPGSKHVLTCQNPKTREDWKKVIEFYPFRRRVYNSLIEPFVSRRVKDLDAVYCQCNFIREKAAKCYDLRQTPEFLPNPVKILEYNKKSETEKIFFLGRFDKEKNPEKFFKLAEKHSGIKFVAAGRAHKSAIDQRLRGTYNYPNLDLLGHVTGNEKEQLLESGWILVNTSVSECLPVSFLEAASAGCAILSPHDPDGFASNFGYQVEEDYAKGLEWLLDGNRWRELGKAGHEYVKRTHEHKRVIDKHVQAYEKLLG